MLEQRKQTFGLTSFLLIAAAAPIWIFLCVVLPQMPGFGASPTRFAIPPIALSGIAFAIYRLVCAKPNSIAVSVLLSPILVFAVLMIASLLAG